MANYVYLVGPQRSVSSVCGHFPAAEVHRRALPSPLLRRREAAFISVGVDACVGSHGYFKGYAIDHDQRAIGFGAAQAPEAEGVNAEGCFVRVRHGDDTTVVTADYFGLMPRFVTSEGGVVAISDSLSSLCEIRRLLGLPVRINEGAVLSRAWENGAADQLHEEQTPIEGIRYCLPSSRIVITTDQPELHVTVEFSSPEPEAAALAGSYEELFAEAARRILGVLGGLADLTDTKVALALSGGLDSRTVLGGFRYLGVAGDVAIGSSPGAEKERAVAEEVVAHCGLALGAAGSEAMWRPDRLTGWGMFNAGVYDPLVSPPKLPLGGDTFSLGGHGAEVCKGTYRWKSVRGVARSAGAVAGPYAEAVARGIAPYGVSPQAASSAEWYNLGYRSPLHTGRFIMSGTFAGRPLLDRGLMLLARSPLNPQPRPRPATPSIISDLLIAFDPTLATVPFAKDIEGLDATYVAGRRARLPGLGEVPPYATRGVPQAMPAGVPGFLADRAADRGFTGGMTREAVLRQVDRGWELVPDPIRSAFLPLRDRALGELADPVAASARPARAAGKIMLFALAG